MTSSGTYSFNLSNSGILLEAFDRIQIRPSQITREQLASGIRSLNLEFSSWANNPVLLWKVDLQTIPLVQGTATYALDASVMMITDAYVTLVQSGQDPIDRILIPISRDEYAQYPDKTIQGAPSVFWFDRLLTPQITLFQVPDGTSETNLNVYRMRRVQDANITSGETPDIPIRFLDAACARVAQRLSVKYQPKAYAMLKTEADEAYKAAFLEDRERGSLIITPEFSGYYR